MTKALVKSRGRAAHIGKNRLRYKLIARLSGKKTARQLLRDSTAEQRKEAQP